MALSSLFRGFHFRWHLFISFSKKNYASHLNRYESTKQFTINIKSARRNKDTRYCQRPITNRNIQQQNTVKIVGAEFLPLQITNCPHNFTERGSSLSDVEKLA